MKRRGATIIVAVINPIKCVASRIMHRAPVIQTVKQTDQLFRKRYIEGVMVMQQLTHVADSSMCIEHIINTV
jgi:hypothetical protein